LTSLSGYSYKAYAINAQGTSYSTGATFTTLAALVAPTVTTPTSSGVTHVAATLGGNVTADGGSPVTERGVVYALTGTNASPQIGGTEVTVVTASGTTGVFTAPVTGLTELSGYSYVAYATNAIGTSYSTVGTFTTLATPVVPTVTSPTVTGISASTATLGGNVTSAGNTTITARGVVYALTSANSSPQIGGTGVTTVVGTGTTGVFTVSATGLTGLSGYSYAAYATNSVGTTYSPVGTFTTLTAPTGWDFGTTDNGTVAPPSSSPANVTLSNLTRGNQNFGTTDSLIRTNSVSSGYAGATGSGNATVAAVGGVLNTATSAYFEFTITPNTGFQTSLTGISFGSRSTSSGPLNYTIRSSSDSYVGDLGTGTALANSTYALQTPTLNSTTSTNGTPLTYRIFAFGGSAAVAIANQGANWRIDDLSLTTTTVAALASPTFTVTAPSAIYTGLAYSGTSSSVGSAGSPAPVVGFTYYVGTGTGGTNLGVAAPINVGTYTVVGSSPVNAGNNAATSAPVTFSITAAPLTVTAEAKSKFVGDSDPAFTYTTSAFVNSETAATALSGSLTRVTGESAGTYAITQGSLIALDGNYAITYVSANLTINATPTFNSASVNGADSFLSSAQRSQLTSLVLNFSAPVIVAPNAFSVSNIGLVTAQSPAALGASQIIVSGSGTNQITLRWGTGAGVITRSGTGSRGNSLADGNWQLSIDPSKVTSGGLQMTGSTDFGAVPTDSFFRLYGDGNGDGIVNGTDSTAMRVALAAPTLNAAFDWDGNGTTTAGADTTNSLMNFGITKRRQTNFGELPT